MPVVMLTYMPDWFSFVVFIYFKVYKLKIFKADVSTITSISWFNSCRFEFIELKS